MNTKLLKQRILDLAIHGRLVPQNPDDEPASQLLRRISEEKEKLIAQGKIKRPKKSDAVNPAQECPFEIPNSWEWVRLGDYITIKSGDSLKVRNNQDGLYPIYGGNGINGHYDNYNIESETLIIGRVGFYCGCVHLSKTRAWITDNAFIVSFDNVFDIYFLFHLLKWLDLGKTSNSTAQPVVSGKGIYPLQTPLPPLAEQQRIVSAIEKWFSLIDEIETNKESLQAAIKQTKSKVLDLAINGKLVSQDINDEPASELLKRINKEKENLIAQGKIKRSKKSDEVNAIQEFPFEIPDSWEWVKLGEIAQSNIGLTYKPSDICDDGVPVLRSNNIREHKISWTDLVRVKTNILAKQYLQNGDLLICARNGSRNLVGKCAIIGTLKESVSFGAFMAVCRSEFNQWIYYILRTKYFNTYLDDSNSTAINQITQKMLLDFLIPLPPLSEQTRIVSKIEEVFALLDEIERELA